MQFFTVPACALVLLIWICLYLVQISMLAGFVLNHLLCIYLAVERWRTTTTAVDGGERRTYLWYPTSFWRVKMKSMRSVTSRESRMLCSTWKEIQSNTERAEIEQVSLCLLFCVWILILLWQEVFITTTNWTTNHILTCATRVRACCFLAVHVLWLLLGTIFNQLQIEIIFSYLPENSWMKN